VSDVRQTKIYADDPRLLGRICFDGKAAVGKLTRESQGVFQITAEIIQTHDRLLSSETHKSVTYI
jgi:hypothetical protein